MSALHPHWQTTDDSEVNIPVRIQSKESLSAVPRAKRSPAAFIGVACFVLIGVVLFQQSGVLIGQVTPPEHEIVIQSEFVDPQEMTLFAGDTITWRNDSDIPHILQSDTLPTNDGLPFESTAIFPGALFEYELPLDAMPGIYDYISQTSPSIIGTIIIEDSTAVSATTNTDVAPPPEEFVDFPEEEIVTEESMEQFEEMTPPPTVPEQTDIIEETTTVAQVTGVPENPHTIANSNTPLPVRQTATNNALHSGAPATAETGMAAWVMAVLLLIALVIVARVARKA